MVIGPKRKQFTPDSSSEETLIYRGRKVKVRLKEPRQGMFQMLEMMETLYHH